jgi:beta-galactosidase
VNLERMRRDVEDPRVVGWGRLPQRAERSDRDTIERISLRGTWDFAWSPTLSENDDWGEIEVPAVWELNGYGTPYYLAFRYPPAIGKDGRLDPSDRPTGVYRRRLDIPEDWAGRRVTLRFESVKSAFHLLIGDELVGYSEGSMTGAAFDLSGVATGSEITVVVHRYSTGTYLEDQDMWFLSGITRDVWLEAEPAHAPWDIAVTTDFDPMENTGSLRVEVDGHVQVHLGDDLIAEGSGSLQAVGLRVDPWSAEIPILYGLRVTTQSEDGTPDVRHLRVGFRRVEIVGEQLCVNGRSIVLHGVNRHDFHPNRIWDVPADVRDHDVALMKAANVNAVRLSHYPNPDQVYRLADEHGLYVMDEAEVESHGVRRRGIPGDDPTWLPSVLARVEAMVRRSRNHPSVIMWSLGNEAGDGEAFRAAKRAVLALDDSRPVHYEGDTTLTTSDVYSLMYPTPELERRIGRHRDVRINPLQRLLNALAGDDKAFPANVYAGRPVIACEYAHAMENSFGNVADHVENFHRYANWAGGFVWDWVDQTIAVPLRDGRERQAYGGAFGETPTDRWFCANGIVAADRTPHPAYDELAKVYQHVVIARTGDGVRLTNRHAFLDLTGLTLRWRLERDGTTVASGQVGDIVTAPGRTRGIRLPIMPIAGPGLWALTVEVGEIAWEQFELARIPAGGFSEYAGVDTRDGAITSLRFGGVEFLRSPLRLNLWRAATDNDRGLSNFAPVLEPLTGMSAWRRANRRARPHRSDQGHTRWRVRGADIRLAVEATPAGVHVEMWASAGRHELVRAGLTGTLDERLDHVEWIGRGRGENYRDRCSGSPLGRWSRSVEEFPHGYAHPQENGNRTGLERLTLTGGGLSLTVRRIAGDPFEASVRPYTQEQLAAAAYADELPTTGPATLSLDVAQRGVGGDKPGDLRLQPAGRLAPGRTWHCAWMIEGTTR